MRKSWGHEVHAIRAEERPLFSEVHCAHRIHARSEVKVHATHAATYQYVTGARGRVRMRRHFLCESHAHEFAALHPAPTTGARP